MKIKDRLKSRRMFFAAACGALVAVALFAYYFLPIAPAARAVGGFLKNAGVIVAQSWTDTFGGSHGDAVLEIDASASSSATGTDDPVASNPEFPITAAIPAKASSSAVKKEKVSVPAPEVIVRVDTTTTALATDPTVVATTAVTQAAVAPPVTCTISTSAALTRKLIFNEIAWMGSPPQAGESASQASSREWMELKNISGGALDVSGWQILDAAGNIKIVLDAGTNIPAGGLFLLERGDDAVPSIPADKIYSGGLPNGGGVLAIVDAACNASDILDAGAGWPAGNNGTKQTLERDADGIGWHTSTAPGGTPKAENSVIVVAVTSTAMTTPAANAGMDNVSVVESSGAGSEVTGTGEATTTATAVTVSSTAPAPAPPLAHLMIAEVQIAGASSSNDFVKIFNPNPTSVDVGGWKLHKKSSTGADYSLRTFPDASAIPAGGYFTWANSGGGFGDVTGANVTSTATLAADNSVALFDASGTLVDAVAWGTGADQYEEGSAYPTDPDPGQVLKRRWVGGNMVDTGNNTNDFIL